MSDETKVRELLEDFVTFLKDETDLTIAKLSIDASGKIVLPGEATRNEVKEAINYFIEGS